MVKILILILFAVIFSLVQGIVYLILGTTPADEAKKQIKKIKNSRVVTRFILEKQIWLKKMGASIFLRDQLTVSQWYLAKVLMSLLLGGIAFFVAGPIFKSDAAKMIAVVVGFIGFFLLDFVLRLQNKSSNDEMLSDIMEMSRSVLYGKKGGQYIVDALKDAVIVVENKRLKTALMNLRNNLDSGVSLNDCLDELEMSFANGEISSFCTVIKSLQATGQVNEALRTLENNIEREQVSVNKRRCLILEHKTMMYVIFIAMDLMLMIMYAIIMKLLALQIGF
ncbi:TPA: type II secretion system F family protein [Clostridioides difficile]|nr:type II secretion system F family protein [Clostridioides difficile]HCQ6314247.1 type II secretion system F family protein [Clostridioides difficile]